MDESSLLEPDLDDNEFAKALWSRYVDSRYFAQRDAADTGNQLMDRAFALLESQQWGQAWEITRTGIAHACLSAPLASPFNSVIGNRINFVFVEIFSLTRLVRDHIVSEMTEPSYVLHLIEALKRAVELDYQQYVEWGVRSANRFENLRDAAALLANPNPMDDVFNLPSLKNPYWGNVKSMAAILHEQMDGVLALEKIERV